MPGEILDFLACLSKLKDGAVVVLHDIILNQLGECIPEYFVTKELLSTVVGEKIVCREEGSPYEYPNIGAFRVTKDTRKYVENLFLALTISWGYMPDSHQLELYRQCFAKDYSKELCEEFEKAISLNRDSLVKRSGSVAPEVSQNMELKQILSDMNEFAEKVRGKKNVWIYGGGYYGEKMCTMLDFLGIDIEGYIVSDDQAKPNLSKRVEYLSDIDDGKCTFVLGMSLKNQQTIDKENIKSQCIGVNRRIIKILHYFS